jgi:hypothetical protein
MQNMQSEMKTSRCHQQLYSLQILRIGIENSNDFVVFDAWKKAWTLNAVQIVEKHSVLLMVGMESIEIDQAIPYWKLGFCAAMKSTCHMCE